LKKFRKISSESRHKIGANEIHTTTDESFKDCVGKECMAYNDALSNNGKGLNKPCRRLFPITPHPNFIMK